MLSLPYSTSSSSSIEPYQRGELLDVKPPKDIFDIDWSKVKVQVFNSLQLPTFQNLSPNPFSSPVNVDFLLENMKRMERIPKRGRPKGRFGGVGGGGSSSSGTATGSSRQPIAGTSSNSSEFKVPEVAKLYGCPYCNYSAKYAYSVYPHVRKQHNGRKVYCIDFPV